MSVTVFACASDINANEPNNDSSCDTLTNNIMAYFTPNDFPPKNNILFRYCINHNIVRPLHSIMRVAIRNYDIQMTYVHQLFCQQCHLPFQQIHKHHSNTCQKISNLRQEFFSYIKSNNVP